MLYFYTEVGDAVKETPVPNPAWVEVAPCPCDLKVQSCDLHCCCDTVSAESSYKLNTSYVKRTNVYWFYNSFYRIWHKKL